MRGAVMIAWSLVACTVPTPRATVNIGPAQTTGAVLALPTSCNFGCDQRTGGELALGEEVDMLVRLKLELAGYTITEAATMRLVTDEREADGPRPRPQTVGELPFDAIVEVARSLELGGILATSVTTETRNHKQFMTITVELRALPDHGAVWRARCGGFVSGGFAREHTVQDLANCAGDGVLAVRAPDALFRRLR